MAWLHEAKRLNKETGKQGAYYAIQWREAGKVRTRGIGFLTGTEAKQMLKVFEGRQAAGLPLDPPPPTAPSSSAEGAPVEVVPVAPVVSTLKKYLDENFLPVVARDKAPRTYSCAQTAAAALTSILGAQPLDTITYALVDAYITARHGLGRRSRTITIELTLLKRCLVHAQKCKVIATVPELPTFSLRDQKKHRFLSVEQTHKLLAALHPIAVQPHTVTRGAPPITRDRLTYLAVLMALNLGMRRGEILSRGWEDVRWDQGKTGALFIGAKPSIRFEMKMRKDRSVPLPPELRSELLLAHAEVGSPASGWIFTAPNDSTKPRKDFGIALRRACRRAGIPVIHPHGLRHTWASRLAMAGVDRRTLMELGGWSSGAMLDEIYSHCTDVHKDDVMARMGVGLPD